MSSGREAVVAFPHVGFAGYFSDPLWRSAHLERITDLLVDPRWPWSLRSARFMGLDKRDDHSLRLRRDDGASILQAKIASPRLDTLHMRHGQGDGNFAAASLDLGRRGEKWGFEAAYHLWITCRYVELPKGKDFAAWMTLLHELATAVGVANAVLGAWPSYEWAVGDTWLTRVVLDAPAGDIQLSPPARLNEQHHLISAWRKFLGRTYARHPRWGTYLNAAHLAAIGGLARVQAEVAPAVITPLGELTYLQLTPSIETAMSPEAEQKRQALEALMAPILVGAPRPTPTSPPSPP